jgi:adenylate kinase family enzyme
VRRILVIGCSGSGKTTLARWLALRLNLPLVILDREYWGPGWVQPPEEEWRKTVRTLANREAWVMDGTYHATLADRLPSADAVVWLDFSPWRCVWRILWRSLARLGGVRSEPGEGDLERIDMEYLRQIWHFNESTRPRIGAALQLARHPVVVVLRSPSEVSRFREEFRLPA